MTPDEAAGEEHLAYSDAVAELERILAELDDDAVDVDVLAARVRRAAELIRVCRERIAGRSRSRSNASWQTSSSRA